MNQTFTYSYRQQCFLVITAIATFVASLTLVYVHEASALIGRIVIAGHGPELPVIQDLAKAYEKRHPGTAIDIEWDTTVRAVPMVKTGEAQVAVTDRPDPALKTTQVAWDGIAVIVNFANPVRELTSVQVRGLFSGQYRRWSDLDGANTKVEVIPRMTTDNLTAGFESALDLTKPIAASMPPIRSDQKALSLVSGRDTAVSYISLAAALKAQEDGIPIQILTIDAIEAGEPTVKSGQYKLRRPVLMLTTTQPDALTASFLDFVRSTDGQRLIRSMYVPVDSSQRSPAAVGAQMVPPSSS